MSAPLVLTLAWTVVTGMEIASDSSCPSATMVRSALDGLGGTEPRRSALVRVRSRTDGLSLEFQWEAEGPIDRRDVATSEDCADRARAAATVSAAWLGVLPAAPASAPVAAVSADRPAAVAVAAPVAAPAPSSRPWWLGLGLGGGAGGGVAAAARVELARVPAPGRVLGWAFGVQGTLPRDRTVAGGSSRWVRPVVVAAATATWQGARVGITADLGPTVGATFAWGSGYASDSDDHALAAGGAGGLRLSFWGDASRSWAEVRVVKWMTTHRLRVDPPMGAAVTADLPGVEAFLTLGWSLPIF